MGHTLSWFETREDALLTMRSSAIQKQRAAMRGWIASSLALLAMTSLTSATKFN
jgi:hypothetical protein